MLGPLAGLYLCPILLGLALPLSHIWAYKIDINDTLPWIFIPHGLLLLAHIQYSLGFNISNGFLGNDFVIFKIIA